MSGNGWSAAIAEDVTTADAKTIATIPRKRLIASDSIRSFADAGKDSARSSVRQSPLGRTPARRGDAIGVQEPPVARLIVTICFTPIQCCHTTRNG